MIVLSLVHNNLYASCCDVTRCLTKLGSRGLKFDMGSLVTATSHTIAILCDALQPLACLLCQTL